jgi:hypothetical protein
MNAADFSRLQYEATDLAWLVRMASDLADRADREGEMGDVTRVAVLLRAIVRSAGEHAKSVAALRDVQGGAA